MTLTSLFLRQLTSTENIQIKKPLCSFPTNIGEWTGKQAHFERQIYDFLGVDDSYLSTYRTDDGGEVQLYIGFYKSQREGHLIHSPKNCMPGSGWNIIYSSTERLTIPNHRPELINMVKLIVEKGGQRKIVFYCFQSRGRYIYSEYLQKVYLFIDSITRNRTDGSFIRLISPIKNGDGRKAAKDLKDFARLLIPILDRYIPS